MGNDMRMIAKKLITALNSKDYKLTFDVKEFMGVEGMPHKYYTINQAIWNDDKRKYDHKALYSTTSMIRIVMYLRDMWYTHNGWELPTDQPLWNKIRAEMRGE